jgi:hypothetical protein
MQRLRTLCIVCGIRKKEAILSWTKAFALPLVAALGLSISGAALAETIVVKSAGPSARAWPPGKSIPDNSKLSLKEGDSITILDGRGTRVLKGPGTFATSASTATGSSFTSLLKNTGTRVGRTGAVRGVGGSAEAKPSNVWLVDATKSGTVCVTSGDGVSVWMPASASGSTLTFTRVSDGKSATVTMGALQATKAWPVDLPVANGEQYRVSWAGLATPVTLKIAMLGPNPQGLEDTAAAFIKAGCNAQLDLLVETVSIPGGDAASN